MSHANAALTPRARLRLARLVVDQGWPIARAAERYDVSWPTAKRWAERYRQLGPAGMNDASSRPHHSPNRTPAPVVRKIVHLRWKQRLGPVADRRPGRAGAVDGARGAGPVPAQPAHPRRPGHRRADPPLRARPTPGRCCTSTSRSSATSPTAAAGASSGASRATGTEPPPRPHRPQPAATTTQDRHRVRAHRHRRPLPGRLRRDPRRRDRRHRRRGAAPGGGLVRRPRRHRRTGAVRQRQPPTGPTCGATPAPSSASPPRRPGPTGPRPTARSNASTAPWPTAGPSRSSTTPNQPAEQLCQHGSTTTTTTGPTPRSAGQHPSPA